MAKAQIKKLAQYGIISDVEPYELPSNAWTTGSNISFRDGGVVRSQCMVPFMGESVDEVMDIFTKDDRLYYTTRTGVYFFNGKYNICINPLPKEEGEEDKPKYRHRRSLPEVEPLYPCSQWSITELSNVLIFSSDSMAPKYLPPSKLNLEDIPNWNKRWRCDNFKAFKNYLLALAPYESGRQHPQRIRWSDVTMPNKPPSDWDDTSTTNSAGFNDLSNTRGNIIDGLELNDKFYIYTEEDVHVVEYVAGNDIFRFRKIMENVGILGRGCVCKVDGGHFVVTSTDVGVHNGNSFKSVMEGQIRTKFFEEIKNTHGFNDVKVISYPSKSEVWVVYKTFNSEHFNKAAIFNTAYGVWTFRELPNMTAIHFGIAPRDIEGFVDEQETVVDECDLVINHYDTKFTNFGLFMAVAGNGWVMVDEGYALVGRKGNHCSIERHYIDLDDLGMEPDAMKQIRAVYPQVTGSGKLYISVGVSDSPYQLPKWSKPFEFDLKRDVKADFRLSGRYVSVKFESHEDSEWRLLGYALDVVQRGNR